QFTVPKGVIFGSSIEGSSEDYSLVSCMVSPGFDYRDFELLPFDALLKVYPDSGDILEKLAYKKLPEDSFRNEQV
ncbi:MAG: cupin domain-containing protein, partial [Trichococcus sp.]